MFKVNFSKLFISGNLEGITYAGSISFPTRESAQIWIDSVMGRVINAESGTCIFESATIE